MGALTIAPGDLPVALDEVKAMLRIASGDEDALIAGLVRSAADLCERFTGRLLIARAVNETLARRTGWQRLGAAPVQAIDAVAALDAAGEATPLGIGDYSIDIDASGEGWVRLHAAPTGARVRVSYVAGMAASPSDLPEALRQGIVRLAAHFFIERDAAAGPPAAVTALWRPWRRLSIA